MPKDIKKLVLFDGMALAYRGHFAMINNPIISSAKLNTSSIYVFANVIVDFLTLESPSHIAVAFDGYEPTFRHKEYPEYKAKRDSMPEELRIAIPYIDRLCEAFNIPVLRAEGWEADDIIGTLTALAENEGFESFMVTPDKDFAQLVSERSRLCRPSKAEGGYDTLGLEEVLREWAIERPEQVIDILGLMGDSSDNIPGVAGVGKKTAQKLIGEYGSIEELIDHVEELKGKQRERIEGDREVALLSKRLVTINRSVPLKAGLEDLRYGGWDEQALHKILQELEFRNLASRLFGADFESAWEEAARSDLSDVSKVSHTYRLIESVDELSDFVATLLKQKSVCFDIETTGLDEKSCGIVGISFCWKEHEATFISFPQDSEGGGFLEALHPFFESSSIEKIGHNIKFDISVLRWCGFKVQGPIFDTMIAAFLCVPEENRKMDHLAEVFLRYQPISIKTLIGEKGDEQKSMREIPALELTEYACEDADVTFRLAGEFRNILTEYGQERVFYEVESPLIPVLVEMEHAGIRLDPEVIKEIAVQLVDEIEATARRIEELAGESFNLNSPKQLGDILFEKLQLDPKAKRTKKTGQYITNEQVLSRLAPKHEIAASLLEYRAKTKLKSTYIDMLPSVLSPETGRVHTTFEQAVAATGRMNSHNPNLQNIPIRRDQGREIRKAFVPRDEDHLLLAVDYSQIELRIAAALSGETRLKGAFESGFDVHTATAMAVFGAAIQGVTPDMRRQAKTVNFGILYGISAFGLAERSDLSRAEAAALIASYFEQYPALKVWQEQTIAFAHENGYVETITGRRRYVRDINSRNAAVRGGAERVAINAPIQGTAADMIKLAMNKIYRILVEGGYRSKMLLQVHDELVFDLYKEERDVVPDLVKDAMVHAIEMDVPVEVELGVGGNWLDAH